jgi:hypothetical protein
MHAAKVATTTGVVATSGRTIQLVDRWLMSLLNPPP